MDLAKIQRKYVNYGNSLYREGYLDGYFTRLQQLVDDDDQPDFLLDVISSFFDESDKLIQDLTKAHDNPVNFKQIFEVAQTLKGSSSNIGAKKLNNLFGALMDYGEAHNLEGCLRILYQAKHEFAVTRSRLETLLSMRQQLIDAGVEVPLIE